MGSIFQFIYVPFSYVMKGCLWIAGNNYFFALFFFALAFQILLFPLAIKQQKSQVKQAKIKPKEQAIRKKYAGRTDRVTQQKMNQEIQEMYQREGFSPLSGCLPLLIQLPLVLILYGIVRNPIQYSSNFTQQAQTQIKSAVTTTSEKLEEQLDEFLVGYVEDIRSHLTTNDAAKAANEELIAKLKTMKTSVAKENVTGEDGKVTEVEAKYDNGYVKYAYSASSNVAYSQLSCSDILANYGETKTENYIRQLKDSGALPSSYTPDQKYALSYVESEGSNAGQKVYYSEMIPNFTFLDINLLRNPSFTGNTGWKDWILLLIPVLVFLTSFLNTLIMKHFNPMQNNPNGGIGSGLIMRVGFPLMSAAFTLMFPAAIGVYWIWRTLIDMIKPVILSKLYPMPTFTEEDYAAAERELKGKQKKKKVITIEVDEDDDSYSDIEVKSPRSGGGSGQKGGSEDVAYRRPSKIEMLSVEEDNPETEQPADDQTDKPSGQE
ncbi:MAG: membrane protein insertase YidC [Clostridia bacterium]|nr:membrane protein insertase YidC [Clostridia bacterium]